MFLIAAPLLEGTSTPRLNPVDALPTVLLASDAGTIPSKAVEPSAVNVAALSLSSTGRAAITGSFSC